MRLSSGTSISHIAPYDDPPFTELLPRELLIQVLSHVSCQRALHELFRSCRTLHALQDDTEAQAAWLLQQRGPDRALVSAISGIPTQQLAAKHGLPFDQGESRVPLVRQLLACPALNPNGGEDTTALMDACYHGQLSLVSCLVDCARVDVNHLIQPFGWTALACACMAGRADLVAAILRRPEVDVNKRCERDLAPLHIAVASDQDAVGIVQLLLAHPSIDVNGRADNGWTPLHHAVSLGRLNAVSMLLDHAGIDVRAVTTKDGLTPKAMAIKNLVAHAEDGPAFDSDAEVDAVVEDVIRRVPHIAAIVGALLKAS